MLEFLPGTDHKERLMHSGDGLVKLLLDGSVVRFARGHRLTKGEWDEAEKWMKEIIDDEEPK